MSTFDCIAAVIVLVGFFAALAGLVIAIARIVDHTTSDR